MRKLITREMVVKDLAQKTNFYMRDIKLVLSELDVLVKEYFADVDDDTEIVVQLVEGVKAGVKVVPPRKRRNPKTQEEIICKEQTKPFAIFSETLREKLQEVYEEKKEK
jgi:nucleoid DNA-binding protein